MKLIFSLINFSRTEIWNQIFWSKNVFHSIDLSVCISVFVYLSISLSACLSICSLSLFLPFLFPLFIFLFFSLNFFLCLSFFFFNYIFNYFFSHAFLFSFIHFLLLSFVFRFSSPSSFLWYHYQLHAPTTVACSNSSCFDRGSDVA